MTGSASPDWTQNMEWHDEYKIGQQAIDEDHQRLFSLYNQFVSAVETGHGSEHSNPFLRELVEYTKYHFHREESLMRRINYPEFDNHKKSHDNFIRQLDEVISDHKAGRVIDDFLLNFMMAWLSGHILIIDKRIGDFLGQSD